MEKKMRKRKSTLALCAALCLSMALASGCGQSDTAGASAEDSSAANANVEAADAGTVSAICPDGWTSVGVSDASSDDADATTQNELRFVKGGSSEEDILTNAYIDIIYYGTGSEIMQIEPSEWYDEVVDIEAFTTGSYTWEGYSAQSFGVPFVYVSCETDGNTLEVYLYTREGTENAAAITDADVLSILESITF